MFAVVDVRVPVVYYFLSMESKSERTVKAGVVVDLEVCELIIKAYLPLNERKCRNADPKVVAAVTEFKRVVRQRKTRQ